MMQVLCVTLYLEGLRLTNAAVYDPNGCSWTAHKKVVADYDDAITSIEAQFAAYKTWAEEDGCASTILGFLETWLFFLRHSWCGHVFVITTSPLYVPRCYATGAVVESEWCNGWWLLITQLSSAWHQIDSLGPEVGQIYQCSERQHSHLELHCIYNFLTHLWAEFQQFHAQLLAHHPCESVGGPWSYSYADQALWRESASLSFSSGCLGSTSCI